MNNEKTGHVQFFDPRELRTPPENDDIYGKIRSNDPDVIELARDIQKRGILEPLVCTVDGFVLSGNRRLLAARMAGLESVKAIIEDDVRHGDAEFVDRLVSFNKQRVKSLDQQAHEIAATTDPATAHRRLADARRLKAKCKVDRLDCGARRQRAAIKGNRPVADAAIEIINKLCDYWPVTDRQIHYQLLNEPPLLHEKKAGRYGNNQKSYRKLTDVLTRLRIAGEIPFECISDETRPVRTWPTETHPGAYLRRELKNFLTTYWRDLQQSQPNHIEVVVEKMTLLSFMEPVCSEYTIPLSVLRGQSSTPPKYELAKRFYQSGKENLILIIMSDLDPAGMVIAESLGRSLRDDFGIEEDRLHCVKAALTIEQVRALGLPPGMVAKKSSVTPEFIRRYGNQTWELEALSPEQLIETLQKTINSVMDCETYRREELAEHNDAKTLEGYKLAVQGCLAEIDIE